MYPDVWAREDPDRTAVVMGGSGATLTYGALADRSARLARHLHEQGLRPGDVVALLAVNDPEVFVVYWAAQRSGLYVTAVNHHLAPAEVGYILADSGARAIVVGGPPRSPVSALATAALDGLDVPVRLAFGATVEGFAPLDDVLAATVPGPPADQPRGADLLYSSGTTGRPKGIRPPLPQRQVDEPGDTYVALFGPMYGFDRDTVYLSPAPLYHAAPLRFCATILAFGGTVVVMERFDARAALELIERYRVTHSQWVPTMFVRMLKLPVDERAQDVSSLRVAIHAAAPCPPDVKRAMIDWWGPVLHEYYAATEGNGITFIDSAQWLARPGSVGRAGLGTLRICDDDGALLPTGSDGTVYFERDTVPFGYHNDPERTRAAQHPAHPTWTTTGDVGHLDEDGYLYLTDRKAFMIISGGVNIYPREIEDCLALHPAVLDVAVIGVPDEEMGQSVLAVVQPAPGVTPGPALADELVAFTRERIARYKTPRRVDFVDTLPRTPAGKLVKRELADRYGSAR